MSRGARWLLWTATLLVAVTGLAYAAMKYLMRGDDPFSAYNHPLQPWALAAHLVLAPALVLALGWVWGTHALPRLNGRGRRDEGGRRIGMRSGLANVALGLVMIASGPWLQVTSLEGLRVAMAWVHGVSGTLFVALLGAHALAALGRTCTTARIFGLPGPTACEGEPVSSPGRRARKDGPSRAPHSST